MNIGVQILYTQSWQDVAVITIPVIQKYCELHNYNSIIRTYQNDFSGFEKLIRIKEAFQNDKYNAIWSLDCDTLITNSSIKIEKYIFDDKDFFITKDYNGINGGSFIIKNSEYGNWFLDECLKLQGEPKIYCEQDAFTEMIKRLNMFADKIAILGHPSINSYLYENYPEIPTQTHEQGQWQRGDFLLHLPGIGMDKRLEILKDKKQHIIYE